MEHKTENVELTVLCLMFAAAALVMFFYTVFYRKNRDAKYIFAILCFSVYYGVLVFGTIISKIMTANIFVDRYLFFAVGLLWMFAAIICSRNSCHTCRGSRDILDGDQNGVC